MTRAPFPTLQLWKQKKKKKKAILYPQNMRASSPATRSTRCLHKKNKKRQVPPRTRSIACACAKWVGVVLLTQFSASLVAFLSRTPSSQNADAFPVTQKSADTRGSRHNDTTNRNKRLRTTHKTHQNISSGENAGIANVINLPAYYMSS